MSNRLADQKSPYLLQHRDNPVDWFPWSDDAFARARSRDKPVFLSIGYSTCHWCHVMEHESFEDEQIARLINEAFVPIKVDREERPDVDAIYMTVCQMMTGRGGWPLSIFMTPDRKPFYAATYIPKESRFGQMGLLDLIPRISNAWENNRSELLVSADRIVETVQKSAAVIPSERAPDEEILHDAFRQLRQRFDPVYGGFSNAPKFPSPQNLLFLLRYWRRTANEDALKMVERTLVAMRLGGIYDQVGFGFHRYSTDRHWLLPHFEKMLYDQAMLAMAYTEMHQATGRGEFRRTAEEIFLYVMRDLRSPQGPFYSAEDADSEGREGKFYVWTVDELRSTLGEDDARLAIRVFSADERGNFEEEATRERTGENVLHLGLPLDERAAQLDLSPEDLQHRLEVIRHVLFDARAKRIRPGLDDKVLTDWNGLMIAALAKAAQAFETPDLAQAAAAAADFIQAHMHDPSGRLLHRYRDGDAAVLANLDDYAYLIWGLLELYEATFDVEYLRRAKRLQQHLREFFWDDENGGFYFTAQDAEQLITRKKEFYDGALPSGNSIAMLNLLRLARMTGEVEYEEIASRLARAAGDQLREVPSAFAALCIALDFATGEAREVVIVGEPDEPATRDLISVVRKNYLPNKVVLLRVPSDGASELDSLAPYVSEHRLIGGRSAAYVCRNFRCEMPATTSDELARRLSS